jgi:hypothetical protein
MSDVKSPLPTAAVTAGRVTMYRSPRQAPEGCHHWWRPAAREFLILLNSKKIRKIVMPAGNKRRARPHHRRAEHKGQEVLLALAPNLQLGQIDPRYRVTGYFSSVDRKSPSRISGI